MSVDQLATPSSIIEQTNHNQIGANSQSPSANDIQVKELLAEIARIQQENNRLTKASVEVQQEIDVLRADNHKKLIDKKKARDGQNGTFDTSAETDGPATTRPKKKKPKKKK